MKACNAKQRRIRIEQGGTEKAKIRGLITEDEHPEIFDIVNEKTSLNKSIRISNLQKIISKNR